MNEYESAAEKRKRKIDRWRLDRERSEHGRQSAALAVADRTREAERCPYLLVAGHRVKGLLVRKADLAVGVGPGLFPRTEPDGAIAFVDGFKLWPSGVIVNREPGMEASPPVIRLRDWTEESRYDTIEIAP